MKIILMNDDVGDKNPNSNEKESFLFKEKLNLNGFFHGEI